MDSDYAPTGYDYAMAMLFAENQILREKCQDPNLQQQVCGSTGCAIFKNQTDKTLYSLPYFVGKECDITDANSCSSPSVCQQQESGDYKCQYSPSFDQIYSGNCYVANKESCEGISVLPYTCLNDQCNSICQTQTVPTTGTATEKKVVCPEGNFGKNSPSATYLYWDDISKTCNYSNYLMKQYYEEQSFKDGNENKKNLIFDNDTQATYITPPYCINLGYGYKGGNISEKSCEDANCLKGEKCMTYDSNGTTLYGCYGPRQTCTNDSDCLNVIPESEKPSNASYDPNWRQHGAKCVNGSCINSGSECYNSGGTSFLESIIGDVILNFFKTGKTGCPNSHIVEGFKNEVKNYKTDLMVLCDDRYIKTKKLVKQDYFGKGKNLYIVEWDTDKLKKDNYLFEKEQVNNIEKKSTLKVDFYVDPKEFNTKRLKYNNFLYFRIKPENKKIYFVFSNRDNLLKLLLV